MKYFLLSGLLAGLVATVITKWKANDKYSFGYVRAETLAGFINGLFLLFISFFIFSEAVERLVEPPEVKHERLLVVSILGFLVNLVGIFVFQHGGAGHGHSHDGGRLLEEFLETLRIILLKHFPDYFLSIFQLC